MLTLGDETIISKLVDGPFGTQIKVEDYREAGIPLLRVSNCRENEVSDTDLVYIAPELHNRLLRSEVRPGDVVFTKTGHVLGYAAVFPERHERANMTSHLVLMRPTTRLLARFLADYLRTEVGQDQVYRWGQKATKPELNTIEIRRFLIPVPERNEQERLLRLLDAARVERKRKLAEADALLAGLDSFLLETLGLTPPPKDDRKVFAVRRADIQRQGRLNSDYFHPERILALRAMKGEARRLSCQRLEEVVSFIRDQIQTPGPNYLSLAHVQSHTGELVVADEEAAGACSMFKMNDVLFARLRPYLNKVYRAEMAGCCSPEFHVLRPKNAEALRPDYLAAILRSSLILAQTRHMMTGNTHPRLTNEDVVNLVIPVPKPALQERIAVEARRRREDARRLRAEAEAGWQAAKRWFEEQLLGGAQP